MMETVDAWWVFMLFIIKNFKFLSKTFPHPPIFKLQLFQIKDHLNEQVTVFS